MTLPTIARRIGVVSARHRINVTYLTLTVPDLQLAAAQVGEDVPRAVHGVGLRISVSAGPRSSGVLHVPSAVGIRLDDAARWVALRHSAVLLGNWCSGC
jgi:hypothetical protein